MPKLAGYPIKKGKTKVKKKVMKKEHHNSVLNNILRSKK